MNDAAKPTTTKPFAVVGVGASAGGLEAFNQLLRTLPSDTGMAFVLIQHLDRSHPSLLSQAVSTSTTMPVCQAEDAMRVEPNHVYVIAPNTDIAMLDGKLVVSPRRTDSFQPYLPVDFFMRSLATELRSHAIGVVLSGSGSDGTEGLRAIRAEDGIAFVQEPPSARFASMPQSAIDAGVVDYSMDIAQLGQELVRLSRHPYEQASPPVAADSQAPDSDDRLRDAIFARVRSVIGVDFREFKPSSVTRRLERRLAICRIADLRMYLTLLETDADEVHALYEDMLIHVTSFFRDPGVFEELGTHVFPKLLESKPTGSGLRVWVAGCSTGEEAYSLAITLLELAATSPAVHPIQIFASDVSEIAIRKARAGVYGESAMRHVSEERRKRYFEKVDGGYRVVKSVRELCVFVRHDLVRDPPFSKLDLVSCRNVLIYFDHALQQKVLATLHYCLNHPGYLVLGHSESISGFTHLFSVADKADKIFVRGAGASSLHFAPRAQTGLLSGLQPAQAREALPAHSNAMAKQLDRLLLARYSPPGVLINENLDVLLFRGHTGAYLQAAPGKPQSNLIGMARDGLISALRETIVQAKEEMVVVRRSGVEVDDDGTTKICDVVVIPFVGLPGNGPPHFVVLFEGPRAAMLDTQLSALESPVEAQSPGEQSRIARLEHELAATKEFLHTLIEEHGRASDELGTTNEELISGNEELQSMNEELETAKEELQSINEELTTLNDELRSRNLEVTRVNTDLLNFALTVDIPILTLDMERRIRRFAPGTRGLFNLLPSDIGRSIDDIKLNFDVPDMNQQLTEVIATETLRETEIKDNSGHWFRMQIRPYKMADSRVDGTIISLLDIHELKQLVAEAQAARTEAERANGAKDDFLATLSHELRTPLSSMLLNAQLLRSGEVLDLAELKRAGDSLERSTWTQVKLIDDLLDVSRIVADKLALEMRPMDLCGAVHASLESVGPLAAAKSITMRVSLNPSLDLIWGDRARVQQVVSNLLSNAIKFTPRGGQVSVIADTLGGRARLRVTDTGIGIDAEFLPNVFARFSQQDRSITRKYGGLGLGLALVRHLVELHGGTVQAESGGTGHGATFSVTFPVAPPPDVADGEQAQATAPAKTLATAPAMALASGQALDRPGRTRRYDGLADLRVLFVDDDLRTREAVSEVLQLSGVRVKLAGSAAEGMAAVDAFMPQVILCDIAMPGEDGYTFMRKLRLRDAERGATIPALALTALAAEEDRHAALAAGFQLHLAKPIDIDRLRDAVLTLSKMGTTPATRP